MAFTDLLHQAVNQARGTFETGPGDCSIAVDLITSTLTAGGWTQTGWVNAIAWVNAPFGMPCGNPVDGYDVDGTNVAICSVHGKGIRWTTDKFPPVAGWINLAPGTTQYESAQILAAALAAFGFTVQIVPTLTGYQFQMTASLLGTLGNGIAVGSVGLASWYSGSGLSYGGGSILQSSSQQDLDTTSANATRTVLQIATGGGTVYPPPIWYGTGLIPGSLYINVQVDGMTPFQFNAGWGEWGVFANNYSAMFAGKSPYHWGDIYVFNLFLFCGSLYVPQALTDIKGVGFILTGLHCPDTLGIGNAFANANTLVNAKEVIGAGWGQHGFSFAYYHYQKGSGGANNLQTREEKSLLVPPLVMMPCTPLDGDHPDDSRIVGYLWDAFIDTSYQGVGAEVDQGDLKFKSRFAQADGAIATVFMVEGAEVVVAPAPGPGTPVSTPTPPWGGGIDWNGTGYYDASTGILSVADLAVDSSWVGKYLSLDSVGLLLGLGSCTNDLGLFLVLGVTGATVSLGPADPAGFTANYSSGWYSVSVGPFSVFAEVTPAPPPQPTWSGVVNVSSFEVDWVSGDLFDMAMAGRIIALGSPAVGYLVSAVSPGRITLTIATAYVNPGGGDSATNIPYSV